jgi:hypothetical protein
VKPRQSPCYNGRLPGRLHLHSASKGIGCSQKDCLPNRLRCLSYDGPRQSTLALRVWRARTGFAPFAATAHAGTSHMTRPATQGEIADHNRDLRKHEIRSGDSVSTTIVCPATGRHSSVIHKADLSDLGEPYLSLVKEKRRDT